jgi:hypothetical protein
MGASISTRYLITWSRSKMCPTDFITTLTRIRAQRNAVESPLLRLPPELRIKIWTLAVKVDRAQVTPSLHHWTYKPTTPQKGGAVAIEEDGGIIMQHPDPDLGGCCPTRQCGAFHLPEVCRQIYVEAATLAYSSNIFTVDRRFFLLKNWARTSLLPAQRDAIAAVELDKDVLRDYLLYQPRRPLVACGLRNLTHVHVSLHTQIDYLRDYPLGSPTRPYNADVWCWLEEEFKAKFKQTEGTDLAVILEDYDDTEPDAEED